MKIFIWIDPVEIYYGWSLAYAIAETVEEARNIILDQRTILAYGQYPEEYDPKKYLIDREPDRIIEFDHPIAEIYKFEL